MENDEEMFRAVDSCLRPVATLIKAAPVGHRPMAQQPGKADTTLPHKQRQGMPRRTPRPKRTASIRYRGRAGDRPRRQERHRERCEMNGARSDTSTRMRFHRASLGRVALRQL